jgi:hypothetical protein
LGTRWQENRTPQPGRRRREAEDLWRARDAYLAKWWLWTLAFVALVVLGCFLVGCESVTRTVVKMHGYDVDPYPGKVSQESLSAVPGNKSKPAAKKQAGAQP